MSAPTRATTTINIRRLMRKRNRFGRVLPAIPPGLPDLELHPPSAPCRPVDSIHWRGCYISKGVREAHRTGVGWVEPRFLEARPTATTGHSVGLTPRCGVRPTRPGASRTPSQL